MRRANLLALLGSGVALLFACATPGTARLQAERIPELPPAEACADVPLLTLAQLQQGEGADAVIAVDGTPKPQVICTLLACGDGSNCCNRCGGDYRLRDTREHVVRLSGLQGCAGSCPTVCEPFGTEPKRAYRFVGMHKHTPAGVSSVYAQSELVVERMCRLNATVEDFANDEIDGALVRPDAGKP